MTKSLANISQRKAAIVVGIAFITSLFLAIFVGNFILPNFINPGDAATLANDIDVNQSLFGIAVVGYLIILALDAAIALALFIVLKPANRILASLSGIFRLLYVAISVIGVLALAFQFINVYSYETIKLWIAYLFFTCHLFVTGYSVFKSGYIPRSLGVLLIIDSFCYVLAFYVSFPVPEALLLISMVFMIIGELSISLWLLLKSAKIPEMIEEEMNTSK
jgi:hypothetical protein